MTDLLQTGSDWLESKRHLHLTRTVTYERGSSSVSLQATIGKTEFGVVDESGFEQRYDARDFLIRSSDLVLDGKPALPERGDRIRDADGATVYVYEVMAPGQEPVYRYSDPYRKTLRVHTKLIETDPA